jgi:hypothetical protein
MPKYVILHPHLSTDDAERIARKNDMARIRYDEQTAAAFKAVREALRDGLTEWRDAIDRHLRASPGMTLLDIGAGTGAFSAAFSDWFGVDALAVEPSAAMRDQIPRLPGIQVFEGSAASPRRNSSVERNISVALCCRPRTQKTRKAEPIGSTF